MPMQHGQMHGEALGIQPHRHTPWIAALHPIDESLDFHQQRARAFPGDGHHAAGRGMIGALQEDGGGIGHVLHAALGHGEDAEFVDGAEAVLLAAQGPKAAAGRGFEHHEAVDHVLQHLRPSQPAFLGDVAHQHHRNACLLGQAHQFRCGLAHLRHAAGQALRGLGMHHLDRIHHHQLRAFDGDQLRDALDDGFGSHREAALGQPQPSGPSGNLFEGLFAAHVQHTDAAGQRRCDLQQQGALASAGIAAHEHHGALHEAAAEHAVQLARAAGDAIALGGLDLMQLGGARSAASIAPGAASGPGAGDLAQRVPLPASGALALPLGVLRAAIGADERCLRSCHLGGLALHGLNERRLTAGRRRACSSPARSRRHRRPHSCRTW